MFVGDADGAQFVGVEAGFVQAQQGLAGGETGIQKNGGGRAFHVDAVATAAGSQHTHA